jgi:hypothetical protein
MASLPPHPGPGGRASALAPRRLPILYFGWAHLCLAAAFAMLAFDAHDFVGFFYSPRALTVVHLITLGWISGSILGALYVIGPLALRMPMPAGRMDDAAFALVVIGTLGMLAHFWIGELGGVGWSGGTLMIGLVIVAVRALRGLRAAPIPGGVKAHIGLAFFNIIAAATLGVLLAFDRKYDFLPGSAFANVYAHAHLAALGWAGMMVLGAGYRLLPMVLPSAMPQGRALYASAILLEAGALGLFGSFLTGSGWLPLFALLVVGGFGAFLWQVGWMKRHPRPAPAALRRPDYGTWSAVQALAYLVVSAGLGLTLAFSSTTDRTLGPAAAYGVLGLVGFLAQMVVGVEARVLPMFAGSHAIVITGGNPPVLPLAMSNRGIQAAVFYLWTAGVPALAAGVWLESAPLVAAGGSLLLTGVVLGGVNSALVLRHAFVRAGDPAAPSPLPGGG